MSHKPVKGKSCSSCTRHRCCSRLSLQSLASIGSAEIRNGPSWCLPLGFATIIHPKSVRSRGDIARRISVVDPERHESHRSRSPETQSMMGKLGAVSVSFVIVSDVASFPALRARPGNTSMQAMLGASGWSADGGI
jgi:hypothetical protein